VSEVLIGSKRFYSKMEKICYAVIMSAHKLRHYFEAHTIKVLANQLLNDIFDNRDSSRRISKWTMELSEHFVDFEKCSAIKSQILADFVVEWTEPGSAIKEAVPESPWLVCHDRAWGAVGAGAAAILTLHLGIKLRYATHQSHEQRRAIRPLVHWLIQKASDEKRGNPENTQNDSFKRPLIKKRQPQKP
jgi:hypothetical protein